MLPININTFMKKILNETKHQGISWLYNYNESSVNCNYHGTDILITYKFNYDTGIGFYILQLYQNGKNYSFTESDKENDFYLLNDIYKEAQASDFIDPTYNPFSIS